MPARSNREVLTLLDKLDQEDDQDGPYDRWGMRLNLGLRKHREIRRFLLKQSLSGRDASKVVMQLLYEAATGRSWLTDLPLQHTQYVPSLSNPIVEDMLADEVATADTFYDEEDMENLEAGFGDWTSALGS